MSNATRAIKEWARTAKDEFNQLDGVQGDGDLGVTVELMAEALDKAAEQTTDLKTWLMVGGALVRRQAPSTMGVLLSFALNAAGRFLPEGAESSAETWGVIQQQMIEEIKKRGGAELGDRTVLDAFIPASAAYRQHILAGDSLPLALEKATLAAREGAESTKSILPKTGRSRWVGDRVIGEVDGGAWLCYKVYQTLSHFFTSP